MMRTSTLLRLRLAHRNLSSRPIRQYSSTTSTNTLESSLQQTLLARPPHIIHDYLSPTPSHLLSLTLADILPPACHPATFNTASPHLPGRHDEVPLPQGHHLVYFPAQLPLSSLLPDGTDTIQSPGPPFTRRLWGGGSLLFNIEKRNQLDLDGTRAVCIEKITDVTVKGKEGDEKVVVGVERKVGSIGRKLSDRGHDAFDEEWPLKMEERIKELELVGTDGVVGGLEGLAVVERRELVFLRDGEKVVEGRVIKPPQEPDFSVLITPTPHLLFRFSALSFNAHSIHLDPQYTREVEGYRNMLVHGPLTLVLMLETLGSQLSPGMMVEKFEYKNLAPLVVGEECRVCVKRMEGEGRWDVWIAGERGVWLLGERRLLGVWNGREELH